MTKITDQQLVRLWQSSYPLSRAWLIFASPEDQATWKSLADVSAIDAFEASALQASQDQPDLSAAVIQAMKGPSKILRDRANHRGKLQHDVLSFITDGHLHGFGFEPPRRLDAAPVPIPKRAWSGRIDWENNTLTFESIQFVEVRLTTNRIRNGILEHRQAGSALTRAPGRPSIRQAVEHAFEALHEAGKIDTGQSMKSHFPAVRRWLDLNRPDLPAPASKLTDEGIRAYFSPKFRALKESKKQ
ncbi:hypothetical protein [Roseovarius ramblicola]|uniref:Uncharacterized protein n=1 Tax=Roseovarius ramblicola TaxID=2022336 RepID=A0ABV5I4K4_9RHOB